MVAEVMGVVNWVWLDGKVVGDGTGRVQGLCQGKGDHVGRSVVACEAVQGDVWALAGLLAWGWDWVLELDLAYLGLGLGLRVGPHRPGLVLSLKWVDQGVWAQVLDTWV